MLSHQDRLRRLAALHRALSGATGVSAREFSEAFSVCHRTFRRDLGFLRKAMGIPVEYNPETYRWQRTGASPCVFCGHGTRHRHD